MSRTLSLVVRRTIAASAERLFGAWTEPSQLLEWWGPRGVTCEDAEVDLRVGGRYRISNRLPDGRVVWISGEYELVDPPRKLVYSWRLDDSTAPLERVTVRFEPKADGTEVTVVHERIRDVETRAQHELGWHGCLDGLNAHVSS